MASPAALTDAELREQLLVLGATVGPITPTTRSVYERQLAKRRAAASASDGASPRAAKPSAASRRRNRETNKPGTPISIEIRKKMKGRRGAVGHAINSSESEDDVPEFDFLTKEDAENLEGITGMTKSKIAHPVTDVLRLDFQSKQRNCAVSQRLPSPQISTKPLVVSKFAEYGQSPPKLSKVYPELPIAPEPSTSNLETSGKFSGVTAHYSNEAQKRPAYLPDERSPHTSFLGKTSDDIADDDEEDDHMESSRILEPEEIGQILKPEPDPLASLPSVFDVVGDWKYQAYVPGGRLSDADFVQKTEDGTSYVEYVDEEDGHMESSRILMPESFSKMSEPEIHRLSPLGSVSRIPEVWKQKGYLQEERLRENGLIGIKNDEIECDEEDDDHMESSRILEPTVTDCEATAKSLCRETGPNVATFLLYPTSCLVLLVLFAYFSVIHEERILAITGKLAGFVVDTTGLLYRYAVLPSIIFAAAGGLGSVLYILREQYLSARAEKKRKFFDVVEKIIDIIRGSNAIGLEYVAEPHVRDMLIPPSARTRDGPEWCRWNEAVKFINEMESRVSTETRVINGVECTVWRWIPISTTEADKSAFEGRTPTTAPDHALSHCLKLRGVFSSPEDLVNADVEKLLAQKLTPIQPLHLHVESNSEAGLAFARFATLADCKEAFTTLHCWSFNGHVVSAKYLRDDRYERRFPDAPRGATKIKATDATSTTDASSCDTSSG